MKAIDVMRRSSELEGVTLASEVAPPRPPRSWEEAWCLMANDFVNWWIGP